MIRIPKAGSGPGVAGAQAVPARSSPAPTSGPGKPGRRTPRARAATGDRSRSQPPPFPIVGLGASAGGLEAFTQLLGALPLDTGLAFVLVQHLDPKHESMLTALLSHATPLPIHEARDGMRLEPNHIYVIPPNTNLAVLHGQLSLMPRTEAHGQHLPVDYFFRSLAADQKGRAIGVILSGTASDGTEGLRAIKAEGGLTFAQEEKSAKYGGMPHSAIAAGVVDFVLPPEGIARELAQRGRHLHGALSAVAQAEGVLPENAEDLKKVFILLRAVTGVDFAHYKPTTLKRRIARRMTLHKSESLAHYLRYLKHTPEELDALYEDLLINVTRFFREPEVFEALKKKVFPRLLHERPARSPIRVWVPGCSTGEEAYSLAIALLEFLSTKDVSVSVQVFATDISDPAVDKARAGLYPAGIAADVSPARLRRFFVQQHGGYQVSKAVRDMCIFARQDVTKDPPFSRLDLISCRNLLIYFGPALQQRVLPTFHYALKPHGLLLLGGSESIGGFASLFALADRRHKLYTRKPAAHRAKVELPQHRPPPDQAELDPLPASAPAAGFDYQKEVDRIVLGRYIPPGVVVNEHLDILQFRGHTGPYLEPAAGSASLNLLKMAREGLLLKLRGALHDALRHSAPARRIGVQVKSDGGLRTVDIEVTPLRATPTSRTSGFLVVFAETAPVVAPGSPGATLPAKPPPVAPDQHATQLRQELAATKEYLQSVITEHERTNEELQSANEEILSSNEELQSTNEELETAQEELQSTNEELTSVNDELHTRNAEVLRVNNNLLDLLRSVQLPIVLLDGKQCIRRFTPSAERVLNLIPTDVGRPLSDLRPNLVVPEFERLLAGVMDSLTPREIEVQDREGRWYSLRLWPYRTLDNKIDGVLLALLDIDTDRRALAQAQAAQHFAEAVVETVRQPLLVLDGELRVKSANRAFYALSGLRPEDTEQRFLHSLGAAQWNHPKLRELLAEVLPQNAPFENFAMDAEFPGVGRKQLLLHARRLVDAGQQAPGILLALEEAKE